MLDQNTDRSWWMIGAVLLGAAMVGITVVAFPELGNSVIDVFKQKLASVK
ncbi:hypothetical protein P9Z84_23835 [Bacillus cereus]|nr:hypothetical protein [Bacillus cereus]MEC3195699.1 hypothetical protein [Bacillus cereus]